MGTICSRSDYYADPSIEKGNHMVGQRFFDQSPENDLSSKDGFQDDYYEF